MQVLYTLCLRRLPTAAACIDLQIRTAMVTGDHVRTAVSVAHLCNILPEGRPVLLMDAAPPGAIGNSPVALSVLYPDGSVNHTVSRAAVLPQVCMVTWAWLGSATQFKNP